jgi:hypothetical protein
MKVKVETILKHDGNKVGDTYEVTETQAKALTALGLVKPANQTAAKAVDKAQKVD